MKQKPTKAEGLKGIIDVRVDVPSFRFKERMKILVGHRVTLVSRVEVCVEIPKTGPTHFSHTFLDGKVAVWKPAPVQINTGFQTLEGPKPSYPGAT